MAKTVSLAIDPVRVVRRIVEEHNLDLPSRIVMMHYDDDVDTLYLHFKYPSNAVDSEIVDRHGEIVLGLDKDGRVVSMTVINASSLSTAS